MEGKEYFTVKIELGNAGMNEDLDVADALRKIAKSLERNDYFCTNTIRDINGNMVGTFGWVKESVPVIFCAFCQKEIKAGQGVTNISGRMVHGDCVAE